LRDKFFSNGDEGHKHATDMYYRYLDYIDDMIDLIDVLLKDEEPYQQRDLVKLLSALSRNIESSLNRHAK
jgi:hypothetical protein